jgi:imidazolonepropionase-like amidohydrolase
MRTFVPLSNCIVVFSTCSLIPTHAQSPSDSLIVQGVRVFDGEHVLMGQQDVLIENGKITRIAGSRLHAESAIVDGRGRTLPPGLVDSHVHVGEDINSSLRQALSLGVTTVLDMFNAEDRLKRMKQIEVADPPDLASLRTAGVGATVPGGHPSQMGGPTFPTIRSPQEAASFVDARIAEGSDYIKIIYDYLSVAGPKFQVPMLKRETLEALLKAAHARKKMVVVHITQEQQARDALGAGADGLAHLFMGETAAPDFGKFVAAHRAFVVPTLSTLYSACGTPDGRH